MVESLEDFSNKNYCFREIEMASDNHSHPLIERTMTSSLHTKALKEWRLGNLNTYLKISELEKVINENFFLNTQEKYYLHKKCKHICLGIATSCIALLSSKRLALIITDIPKERDCFVFPLSSFWKLKRFCFEGVYKGLEVTLVNRKSFLLRFDTEEDQHHFSKKIVRVRKQGAFNLLYENTLNPKSLFKISGIKEDWTQGRISNFRYLMALNSYTSRSYHDPEFHPSLPQVVKETEDRIEPSDLSDEEMYNASGTGNNEVSSADTNEDQEPKMFSRMATDESRVQQSSINFLVRKYPYNKVSTGLIPFKSSSEIHQDEKIGFLVSEFFSEPSFLLESGKVPKVELPYWARDPYHYIYLMRKVLESDKISINLNVWIDQNFGWKSFTESQEEGVDRNLLSFVQKARLALEEGGKIKSKVSLFEEKHPSKNAKSDIKKFGIRGHKLRMYEPNENQRLKSAQSKNMSRRQQPKVFTEFNPQEERGNFLRNLTERNQVFCSSDQIIAIQVVGNKLIVAVTQSKLQLFNFKELQRIPRLSLIQEYQLPKSFASRAIAFSSSDAKRTIHILWKFKAIVFFDRQLEINEESEYQLLGVHRLSLKAGFGEQRENEGLIGSRRADIADDIPEYISLKIAGVITAFQFCSNERSLIVGTNKGWVALFQINLLDLKEGKGETKKHLPLSSQRDSYKRKRRKELMKNDLKSHEKALSTGKLTHSKEIYRRMFTQPSLDSEVRVAKNF